MTCRGRAGQYSRGILSAIGGPHAASPPRPDRRLSSLAALPAAADEVNIYSSRHYDTDEALYSDFTEATGITVNRIEGTPEELIARMQAEGANSPADIFLTVDAGRIWLADREGLLQPVQSEVLERAHPRAPAPPRRPLVRLLAAGADHLLRQGPGAEPAADLRGAGRSGLRRARSASAPPRTSTTSR